MTRRPIRSRLILAGVGVIVAIIGACGLIMDTQRQASIDAFGTATTNLGTGMAQQTAQALGSVDRALAELQARLKLSPADALTTTMRQKATFDFLVEQHSRLSDTDALFVVDAAGMLANSSRKYPSPAIDFSASDFFRTLSAPGDHAVYVGKPFKSAVSNDWTTFIARRIDDSGGQFAGVAVAEISLAALRDFYHLAMPPHRSVYVLRRDGVILVRYPPRDSEIGKTIPDQSPWYTTVAQGGGKYDAAGYFDPAPVIAAVAPLPNLPLVVEASVSEADTLADWYVSSRWVVFGGFFAIICAVVLLRLLDAQYRRIELSEQSLEGKNVELAVAHGQLDATLANLSQGVCFYDKDSKLVVCNSAYRKVYNLRQDQVRPGMPLADVAALRVAAGSFTSSTVNEYLAIIKDDVRAGEPKIRINKLTNGRTVSAHLQPLPGRGWVVTIEDITDRCEAEAKIAFLARHDVLTGLANRSLFQEQLGMALAMAERGSGFALLCLDLDGFKAVNDTYGHPIGDSLLRAVTGRLLAVMREIDTVARLGGDEFAILQLGASTPAEVTVVARRLIQSINEPFELDGRQVSVGISIGIAMAPTDSILPERLMKAADLALYRAKQEGRGIWRFFETSMDAVARGRRALEVDLRKALPLGQMELHYQPLVWTGDRSLTGFEALLRWHHPTRGLVPTDEFISVAEETGLIGEIGGWVLRQACAEAMKWPDHLRVSVNLSPRQFHNQNLIKMVTDALLAAGLPAERLELEITETVPLQESQTTLATLHDLRSLGASIALDDFGTGFSSLSYLRGFPFDTIKIDRSFVSDLQIRDNSVALIRGIIGLAIKLRMSVAAEGVETEGQFNILAAAGCTEIQGFLISPPVPADELPGLIERLSGRRDGPRAVYDRALLQKS